MFFGMAGSQIVNRRYIAHFVQQEYWQKYNAMLVKFQCLGMILGPVCYLILLELNQNQQFARHTFEMPGWLQGFLGSICLVLFLCFFEVNVPQHRVYDEFESHEEAMRLQALPSAYLKEKVPSL